MLLLFLDMIRVRDSKGCNGKSVKDTKLLGRVMVGFSVEIAFCVS